MTTYVTHTDARKAVPQQVQTVLLVNIRISSNAIQLDSASTRKMFATIIPIHGVVGMMKALTIV